MTGVSTGEQLHLDVSVQKRSTSSLAWAVSHADSWRRRWKTSALSRFVREREFVRGSSNGPKTSTYIQPAGITYACCMCFDFLLYLLDLVVASCYPDVFQMLRASLISCHFPK